MGCDSHPAIEVKGRNGRWGLRGSKGLWWRAMEKNNWSYDELAKHKPSYIRVLGERDYDLFAVLADVRNANITPLFSDRGVPDDVTQATMKEIPLDSDYHSHTYFTLEELLNQNWDEVAGENFGVCIYAADYMAWKENGAVPGYAAEYAENMDKSTREVSNDEMVMMLLGHTPEELTKFKVSPHQSRVRAAAKRKGEKFEKPLEKYRSGPYVKVVAPLTYRQIIPYFIDTIPDMKKLGDPDRVRVVIAFDN